MISLLGKRIVCTGAVGTEAVLIDNLTRQGATALHYPCIELVPVHPPSTLDAILAAAAVGRFTWVAFTSTATVEQVANRLRSAGLDRPRAKLAAVGSSTATRLKEVLGSAADFVPATFTSSALAAEMPIAAGDSVLVPQADIASPALADGLRSRAASVTTVTTYQTITGTGGIDLPGLLEQRAVDGILFASPSAIRGCLERFSHEKCNPTLLASVPLVCIGPVTAEAARANGLTDVVIARNHTRAGMIDALAAEFSAHWKESLT
jgi:uroporphyrinogen-III synthase